MEYRVFEDPGVAGEIISDQIHISPEAREWAKKMEEELAVELKKRIGKR